MLLGNDGYSLNVYPPAPPESHIQQLQAQQNVTWGALEYVNENIGLIAERGERVAAVPGSLPDCAGRLRQVHRCVGYEGEGRASAESAP